MVNDRGFPEADTDAFAPRTIEQVLRRFAAA